VLRKGERGRRLDGSHFFFSYNNNGHYGHLMTEALSRLWGWWPAKAEDPSLRILCRLHPTRGDTAAERLETFLLPALGISPEDIVWVDGPVEVESLVGCTPMWHNAPPLYFHPAMLEVWDRLRTGVMREDAHPGPSRLFITRRVGGRPCSNLGGRGALRRPWLHGRESRAAQCARAAALFAGARVVAGFGGSGMLNLAYAQAVETVIVLNQWAYRARNEHLFAAAHGAAMHCFWSRPDADHPEGGFSYAAHQGSWTFDTAGNGPPLRALLACLEH
jgi:capsular polysaccharide biosynthesis protein